MFKATKPRNPNRATQVTQHAFSAVHRILHIEAMSGIVLLIAAISALIWSNTSYAHYYSALWHMPLGINFSRFNLSWDLHFWVNDVLMTIFFLVAGMEIRREIYDGALANIKQATLPIIAAIGGVCLPAIIYIGFNLDQTRLHGWAVPTATDIAFAVGILALLGKSVPTNLRVILLSLAIIDDIIAVLIIALFYSSGIDPQGMIIIVAGIVLVILLQWIGISSAWAYIIPGAVIWIGLFQTGIHPSLAGVILGMLTPVMIARHKETPLDRIKNALAALQLYQPDEADMHHAAKVLKDLHKGQRDILAPVTRVQIALHPWVAFGIMPLFAFANAGVSFDGFDISQNGASWIIMGIAFGLVLGKPIGILLTSFIAVKLGFCRLPSHVSWSGILLVGLLAGIGFTMAIFVAMLAFTDPNQLSSAKIGVLLGSGFSATLGLIYGVFYLKFKK